MTSVLRSDEPDRRAGDFPLTDQQPPPASAAGEAASAGGSPPGLREQLRSVRAALTKLVQAHVSLAREELGRIVDEIKRVALLVGLAVGLLFFLGVLVPVGGILFMGEFVFGSMGWGVLLGSELCVAIAALLVMQAIERGGAASADEQRGSSWRAILGPFLIAVLIGLVVALIFGLNLSNEAWDRIGSNALPGISEGPRPLLVGVIVGAVVGAIVGLLIGGRIAGGFGVILGAFFGAIGGLIVGAFTSITFGLRVGIAIGLAVGLFVWPIVAAIALWRRGLDLESIRRRFTPTETIAAAKETMEWARQRSPRRPTP